MHRYEIKQVLHVNISTVLPRMKLNKYEKIHCLFIDYLFHDIQDTVQILVQHENPVFKGIEYVKLMHGT